MNSISPYKYLFCIGFVYALIGSGSWIFFRLGWMDYPTVIHGEWMMLGFLLSYVMGFLMTAIPRFLNAPVCKKWELIVAIILALLPLGGFWLSVKWVAAGGVLQLCFLAYFGFHRFRRREFDPPPSFIFLPLGIFSGVLGCLFIIYDPTSTGRVLVLEGMMLAFILGVGAKLITALLGWSPPVQIDLDQNKFWKRKDRMFLIEAFAFLSGMLIHAMGFVRQGDALWAIVSASIGLRLWKLYRLPLSKSRLSLLLWLASLFVVLGLGCLPVIPSMRIHFIHFVYIGGMALMTLMIATRVILSHGGYPLLIEVKSRSLLWTGILVFVAALTRVFAPYMGFERYFNHLAYASIMMILGFSIWAVIFLKKIF